MIPLFGFSPAASPEGEQAVSQRQAEVTEDYYAKWLKEDVTYIITPEERQVFDKLDFSDGLQRILHRAAEQRNFRSNNTAIIKRKGSEFFEIPVFNDPCFISVAAISL